MKNPCFSCRFRAESIANVAEFMARNPSGVGLVNDPVPKAECKFHEGYGRESTSKIECREFVAIEV